MTSAKQLLPPDSEASAARRRKLSEGWLTESEADLKLGGHLAATAARRSGKVLAVWIADKEMYLYPDFQFGSQGALDAMSELLPWLPRTSGSGWDEIEWLYAPHALLAERPPAEVLVGDPRAVVEAAEREFTEDPDARW